MTPTNPSQFWFNPYPPGYKIVDTVQGAYFNWNMSFHLHVVSYSRYEWPGCEVESHVSERWGGREKQSRIRRAVEDFYQSRLDNLERVILNPNYLDYRPV